MKQAKFLALMAAVAVMPMMVACSDDNDNDDPKEESEYTNKAWGNAAIDGCVQVGSVVTRANNAIAATNLNASQTTYLQNTVANIVDNVIVPTYTKLADATEKLDSYLDGLTVNTLTQSNINSACQSFKDARAWWEKSEAFLGGAASDFDVDPTIDSWPLNRTLLLTYLSSGKSDFTEEELEDATILGFHALEFILFRNGAPRKVAEFQGNDTYKGFTGVSGAVELAYAQRVCELLKERTFQLQIAWEGETAANASRAAVVRSAGLDYQVEGLGISYGENMKNAGLGKSTFTSLKEAIEQLLSMEEGSCFGISNEVGTAKIANPFSAGDVSYVESPYSYNSIVDFQNNIRSIENVWFGNVNGEDGSASYSFHGFFNSTNQSALADEVEDTIEEAIEAIGDMPAPFVKYVCTIWGIAFEDDNTWE